MAGALVERRGSGVGDSDRCCLAGQLCFPRPNFPAEEALADTRIESGQRTGSLCSFPSSLYLTGLLSICYEKGAVLNPMGPLRLTFEFA